RCSHPAKHFPLPSFDGRRASTFEGHRYAYAVHNRNDLEKHPQLHVIVALSNASGKMLNPNIRDFTEWRVRFADKARERGIP
ncbi:hypothetical protein ACC776_37625, partial [Rhizobium johnstonii]